ncbi:hypothetical protein D3C85_867070 [compost metagenome]
MADHKLVDDSPILLSMLKHMWPWTNYTHIPQQDIKELRQLIKTGFSQELADWRNPVVVFSRLFLITIIVNPHTSEFIAPKRFVIPSASELFKQDRSFTLQFNQNCN